MIKRIVKMSFQDEHADAFAEIFHTRKSKIEAYPGCNKVQLYRDIHDPGIYVTISSWDTEKDLENYRYSEFFKETWETVKPMFRAKAEARSYQENTAHADT